MSEQQHNNALDEIIKQRYAEVEEIRQMGITPYPNRCDKQISCADAKNSAEGAEAVTAGRLMQIRFYHPFCKNNKPRGMISPRV